VSRILVLAGGLALAFVVFSTAVGFGWLAPADSAVFSLSDRLWHEELHPVFQALALLGGFELTLAATAGLAFHLYRQGLRREAWVALVFPLAMAIEVIYKHLLRHPGPERELIHEDGPSVSELFTDVTGQNSYPSGHVMRTALVYGLVAFVIFRLGPPGRQGTLVVVAAILLAALMAVDRLYLAVHWTSDVVGGLLLGGILLLLAVTWLERVPRQETSR
jgi:undecaprenyl-diphosphatase